MDIQEIYQALLVHQQKSTVGTSPFESFIMAMLDSSDREFAIRVVQLAAHRLSKREPRLPAPGEISIQERFDAEMEAIVYQLRQVDLNSPVPARAFARIMRTDQVDGAIGPHPFSVFRFDHPGVRLKQCLGVTQEQFDQLLASGILYKVPDQIDPRPKWILSRNKSELF